MGIPIPQQHHPAPALAALVALGALLVVAAGPLAYWAINNLRPGSSPPPVAIVTPTPSPVQSPTPSPSPSPSPISVVATLHGKIAISAGNSGSGGWIQFPGGAFTADPKSNVALPGLGYANGLAWNASMNAWVPVNWYLVRQDGQVYAFMNWTQTGVVVQVVRRNGTTYQLGGLPQNVYSFGAISAEPEGVYVVNTGGQGGLWLLDYSGGVKQLAQSGFWQVASFGYAYGTITSSVPQGGTNVIRRMNLKTGLTTDWFTRPGKRSQVVGVTINGTPIIESTSSTTDEVWLGTQTPKLLATNYAPPSGVNGQQPYVMSALGDQVGIWIATTTGLYLYTDKAGLEFASSATGQLASTIQ